MIFTRLLNDRNWNMRAIIAFDKTFRNCRIRKLNNEVLTEMTVIII